MFPGSEFLSFVLPEHDIFPLQTVNRSNETKSFDEKLTLNVRYEYSIAPSERSRIRTREINRLVLSIGYVEDKRKKKKERRSTGE